MAVALAEDYLTFRGEPAVAHGWLRRAHRLLEGVEPCAERGWLACLEGYIAFIHHADSVVALKAGAAAAEYLSKGTQRYEEDLEDLFQAALERARRRRMELMESSMDKTHLRRGWIAYPEYWQ